MKSRTILVATLVLVACDVRGNGSDTMEAAVVPALDAPEPKPAAPLHPGNIFYDLTRFEWYARGEALLHDSIAFDPLGGPVPLPLAELEHVGNYQGVDFYQHRSAADRDAVRYVPVYEGYWLRFAAPPSPTAAPN